MVSYNPPKQTWNLKEVKLEKDVSLQTIHFLDFMLVLGVYYL